MTEVKRCPACNRSNHYRCYKGSCACKCMTHEDTTKNKEDKPYPYSKESDEVFEIFMKSWRNI